MRHIKQKTEGTYTIVQATEPLENHPSILNHPDLFEIVDGDIPEHHNILIYQE
jgi:hypothetical protein